MIQNFKFQISHSRAILVILFAGCIVNLIAFNLFGVKIVNDSARYFEYRDLILANGFFIDRHNVWYVGYVLFLLFCKVIGLGNLGTVVLQCLLSILASVSVYLSTKQLTESGKAGLLSALLFLSWIKISQWNMYILCESLYISFTAITCYYFLRQSRTWKTEIISIALLLFTFFLKPAGISLVLAGIVFYLIRLFLQPRHRMVAALILFIGILFLSNTMLTTFRLVETYATGDIIYGCSWAPSQPCPEIYTLKAEGLTITYEGQPLLKVVLFFIYNPWFSIKLAFAKLIAFLLHIKPYYSIWHNGFIALTLFPAYYFSIRAINSVKESRLAFVIVYLLSSCLVIMLTVEDWDGRFLMPLLPLIFIFTGVGIYKRIIKHANG
ncbi:MAG: glycosyltransferase family 39 protein [Flammeovirgaceae bacterium]|nr:glycosyltransferase family 39 protein [Flammeovirgaceae bacterium]